MARIGVQFSDIEKAALELQGGGKVPTVDGIREILGTGSKSTIAQHLRAWRTKQTGIASDLPHELAAFVTGLWKKLQGDADQRVDTIETDYCQQTHELNQTLTHLYQEQTLLKKQCHQSEEIAAHERCVKESLEKQLQEHRQEQARQHERSLALTQQLEASKAENVRLHQLATNIQKNLEHYQEKMHNHQIEQSLLTEKQQGFYIQEITKLQQQTAEERSQIKPLEQERAQLQKALGQLENQHQQLIAAHEATVQQFQETTHENRVFLERDASAKKVIDALQNKIHETTSQLQELEKKAAILLDQNARLTKEHGQAQDKIDTLRQENLFLFQEKSQLEGYLNKVKPAEKSNH